MLTDAHLEGWSRLTRRQRQCIEALRAGHCSDKAVARVVGVQVGTVAEYLKQAREVLGVGHRIELVLIAERVHVRRERADALAQQAAFEPDVEPLPFERPPAAPWRTAGSLAPHG